MIDKDRLTAIRAHVVAAEQLLDGITNDRDLDNSQKAVYIQAAIAEALLALAKSAIADYPEEGGTTP